MPPAVRLGIFGSCVSRDMAHEHPDCTVVFYVARQSLLSAMSEPHPTAEDLPLDLASPFQSRMVRGDLSSNLLSTVRKQAGVLDALVIDLVDERLGVVPLSSTGFATNSQEFKQSGLRELVVEEPAASLELGDPDHLRAWTEAAHTLIDVLEEIGLAHKTVVLRTAFAELTKDGQQVPPYMNIPASVWNERLAPYFRVFQGRGIQVLNLPAHLSVADPNHRWGISPYHYGTEAYSWLMGELRSALDLNGDEEATGASSRVRLPVSLPVSRVVGPPSRGGVRLRISTAVPPKRWRLRISNVNERTLGRGAGPVHLDGVWVGPEDGAGEFRSPPMRLMPRFTVPADDTTFVTPWFTSSIGDGNTWLVAFGWTSAEDGLPVFSLADSYQWHDPESATTAVSDHLSGRRYVPLTWVLEVETAPETSVVATWSDERVLSTAEGAALLDSALSRWARSHRAVAVHAVYPGTSMSQWSGYSRQWDRIARPPAGCEVFHLQGWHDLVNGATVEQLRERFEETMPSVRLSLGESVGVVLLDTFRPLDDGQEKVRQEYNAWLTSTFEGSIVELVDGSFVLVRPPLTGHTALPTHQLGDAVQ